MDPHHSTTDHSSTDHSSTDHSSTDRIAADATGPHSEIEVAVDDLNLDEPRSRRGLLRIAGAAAVGGVAALAAGSPAAADDGIGLIGGSPTTAAAPVRTRYSGAAGNIGYLFESGTASTSNATAYPAVIGAWAKSTGGPRNGVYAFSELVGGAGVFGEATGTNGVGLVGIGPKCGVEGRNEVVQGVAVRGIATGSNSSAVRGDATGSVGYGVFGTGEGAGVYGVSPLYGLYGVGELTGVFGSSTTGAAVEGETSSLTRPAVSGYNDAIGGVGVAGKGDQSGSVGVQGTGRAFGGSFRSQGTGVGLTAAGGRAQLLLAPEGVAPPSRTEAYKSGEIVVDAAGDFWVCVALGTPGTWRKLAGPSTSGAFHAIDPSRVYDSRLVMTPTANGPLEGGQSRVIPVADRRNVTTGEVNAVNVVPAGATAVAYNVTVTQTSGGGFAYVAPGDAIEVSASTINWADGNTAAIANAAVVKLDGSRRLKVFVGGGASTQFIIDITGYYR